MSASQRTLFHRRTTKPQTGLPSLTPPPPGLESAIVSTLDDLKVTASYGSWTAASDTMNGAKSTSSIARARANRAPQSSEFQKRVTGTSAGTPPSACLARPAATGRARATNSGRIMTLWEVAAELFRRMASIFFRSDDGSRPVHGESTAKAARAQAVVEYRC